ncbi:hypothetical protein Hanom_Chr04g00361321 [Helianthus anomalus]
MAKMPKPQGPKWQFTLMVINKNFYMTIRQFMIIPSICFPRCCAANGPKRLANSS